MPSAARWLGLGGWLVSCSLAVAQEYAGAQACRACHPKEAATQLDSHHALALRPALETALPQLLRDAPIHERSGLTYSYAPADRGLAVTVRRQGKQQTALLRWAFGSGAQAITPVGFRDGFYFEHRVSYYTAAGQPGRTLGHSGDPAMTLDAAFGIRQPAETISKCFGCHATGVRAGADLENVIPGVTCERCHGPSAAHAASHGSAKKLTRLSAREVVNFCAECHRSPATEQTSLNDPMSIRFQPVGLMASKCFQKSGNLSCITCHNPHDNASHDPQKYMQTCLGCHNAQKIAATRCGIASRQNCLPCHMAKRSPAPMLSFTDHRIRINQ